MTQSGSTNRTDRTTSPSSAWYCAGTLPSSSRRHHQRAPVDVDDPHVHRRVRPHADPALDVRSEDGGEAVAATRVVDRHLELGGWEAEAAGVPRAADDRGTRETSECVDRRRKPGHGVSRNQVLLARLARDGRHLQGEQPHGPRALRQGLLTGLVGQVVEPVRAVRGVPALRDGEADRGVGGIGGRRDLVGPRLQVLHQTARIGMDHGLLGRCRLGLPACGPGRGRRRWWPARRRPRRPRPGGAGASPGHGARGNRGQEGRPGPAPRGRARAASGHCGTHSWPSSFNIVARASRPRDRRDFTVPSAIPSSSAISCTWRSAK